MSRPTTLSDPLARLAMALGGVQRLADTLGVSLSCLHDWSHGSIPRRASRLKLAELWREHRIRAMRWE